MLLRRLSCRTTFENIHSRPLRHLLSTATSKSSNNNTKTSSSTTSPRVIYSDVAIVGGGLVGTALACGLRTHVLTSHLDISLIDSAGLSAKPDEKGKLGRGLRQSTITETSKGLLERIGVWDELLKKDDEMKKGDGTKNGYGLLGRFERMVVWDGGSCLKFEGEEGGMGWVVDNDVIRGALWEKILESKGKRKRGGDLEVVIGDVVDVDVGNEREGTWGSVKVQGKDKGSEQESVEVRGRLVIGADGGRSMIREKAGLEWVSRGMGRAVVANVKGVGIDGIAWQRFLDDRGSAGVLAVLPMGTRGWANVIWSTNEVDAQVLMGLDDRTFVDELNVAIQGRSGVGEHAFDSKERVILDSMNNDEHIPFPFIDTVVGKRATFPLAAGHAPEYVDAHKRVALVGDAAHCVHPLAGQGVNMGFADVSKLVDCIAEAAATGRDIGADRDALQKYQSNRMVRNIGMISLLHGLKSTFGINWAPFKVSRRIGVGALNQMAPLKQWMMKAMT